MEGIAIEGIRIDGIDAALLDLQWIDGMLAGVPIVLNAILGKYDFRQT